MISLTYLLYKIQSALLLAWKLLSWIVTSTDGKYKDNKTRGAECKKNPSISPSPETSREIKRGEKKQTNRSPQSLQMLKGMLLVINVWGRCMRLQLCVGERGSWGGRNSPTCIVTKCNGIQKSGDAGLRGHKGGRRWKRSKERWVLPLQFEDMYTGGWAGEVRTGGGAESNRERKKREKT